MKISLPGVICASLYLLLFLYLWITCRGEDCILLGYLVIPWSMVLPANVSSTSAGLLLAVLLNCTVLYLSGAAVGWLRRRSGLNRKD